MRAVDALGVVPHVPAPNPLDEADCGLAGGLDGRIELVGLEVVAAAEARNLFGPRTEHPARPASASHRDVDASDRLETELPTTDEHVERQLEEVAFADVRGRRGCAVAARSHARGGG